MKGGNKDDRNMKTSEVVPEYTEEKDGDDKEGREAMMERNVKWRGIKVKYDDALPLSRR